jgi:hypothetical protein
LTSCYRENVTSWTTEESELDSWQGKKIFPLFLKAQVVTGANPAFYAMGTEEFFGCKVARAIS